MPRKLAITLIIVLTTSLALLASATARILLEPPPGATSSSTGDASSANAAGFTAQGSPIVFVGTRFAGDPAAFRAQPTAFGGGGSYAAEPAADSNARVPGLQP